MDPRTELLALRGQRARRVGAHRKALVTYGELTAHCPHEPRWWTLLAACQDTLGRAADALRSLRQAAYLLRQRGDTVRGDTLQTLIQRVSAGEPMTHTPRHHGRGWRRGTVPAHGSLR